MGETIRLKTTFSKYFSYAFIALSLLVSVYITVANSRELFSSVPFLLAIAIVVWVVFAHPYVEVADGGITIVNIIARFHVPWPLFTEASTEWNLRVHAGGRVITAWALPIASGSARRMRRRDAEAPPASPHTAQGAALLIGERYTALKEAGHLDGAPQGEVRVTRETNPPGVVGLVLATVLITIGLG